MVCSNFLNAFVFKAVKICLCGLKFGTNSVLKSTKSIKVYKNCYITTLIFYAKQQKQLNLIEAELDALNNLSNKPSIVICKPDKGNGVVLLDIHLSTKNGKYLER